MSKEQHADSIPDEKAPHSPTEVLVEAARNGDTTAVQAGLEKLSPDTDSKKIAFDAVHEACRGNHDECLALLLPYVETTQMGFGVLLSECIHADHTACTEVLLQHWKSVCSNVAFVPHGQKEETQGNTPRPCPAMWEDPAVCQVLIDAGTDIETKDDLGRSPLHWACRSGALAVVKMLVKAGAEVRVTDNDGDTCLTLAAYFGHTETVHYLVNFPEVDVNHKDTDSHTALFLAADQNHPDVAKVLIDAGADIEATDEEGYSPMLMASQDGSLETMKMLVKAGADVCVTDNKGATCLLLAAWNGQTETVRYLLCLPEVDVNQSCNSGFTALHLGVLPKHSDVVEVLVNAGADVEAKRMGRTPLHCACEVGEREIVKMLLEARADVCATDNDGDRCLALAAHYGNIETVRYLVGLRGVDVNHRNIAGHTALTHARLNGHAGVEQVLLKHGGVVVQ